MTIVSEVTIGEFDKRRRMEVKGHAWREEGGEGGGRRKGRG